MAYGARSDTTGAGDSALTGDPNAATTAADSMAESLALARELMEEEVTREVGTNTARVFRNY